MLCLYSSQSGIGPACLFIDYMVSILKSDTKKRLLREINAVKLVDEPLGRNTTVRQILVRSGMGNTSIMQ